MDQAGALRRLRRNSGGETRTKEMVTRGIAVASGKGGVGKTNTVANLAYAMKGMGKKVLVFDADMGLGNIHILLGLAPRYNLDHVISGEKSIDEVIIHGPGGIEILPTSSGNRSFSELTGEEKLILKTELETLNGDYDFILFDIGAGISSNVMYFCSAASEIVAITTSEPTAFADAYALVKVLSRDYDTRDFKLIVNQVKSVTEASNVANRLTAVADKFSLDVNIDLLGHILTDEYVTKSVRSQRLFMEMYPGARASDCIRKLAKRIVCQDAKAPIEWEIALAM